MMNVMYLETPIGLIRAADQDGFLTELDFVREKETEAYSNDSAVLKETERQLQMYFSGKRRDFDLPVRTEGTVFQKAVWNALREIPYGEAKTYGEIAAAVGKPGAARAVGSACHHNPVSIVIPCHRVLGASGKLTGYGGGLEKKEFLLDLEGVSYRKQPE
ncbi:MAG TPA: methylated-DNA--[protein]-cysteine S-methyltransferase [Oscillospiraceae bacterium]|nr:methylated-DNA--[protein]-cysteine S-methyltransferase [Oscillospiraceae bacterium]HXK76893.1 methylated-DNA--[protein]-cysteine S-methyltransferase [Oscillospiraceae bacterium]